MSGATWLQFLVLIALVAGATPLLGGYMAKVYAPETAGVPRGERLFGPIERVIYRLRASMPSASSAGPCTPARCWRSA